MFSSDLTKWIGELENKTIGYQSRRQSIFKVALIKAVMGFGKSKKLGLWRVESFEILEFMRSLAY